MTTHTTSQAHTAHTSHRHSPPHKPQALTAHTLLPLTAPIFAATGNPFITLQHELPST
ncbi:Hypothetical protein FKW44_003336 [Caligus rogercresseyi]|uniref:Uncharacterized protein n=1 Tax=Caligus rogercresseyi TaxID=217165 RepID=A0A7T8KLL4_CALRO|nr:Hypothetical protein FKW44_003336 [Caligus rogercresseyi]